jgi:hypothetical protein
METLPIVSAARTMTAAMTKIFVISPARDEPVGSSVVMLLMFDPPICD